VLVLFPFVAANFGNSWVRIIDFALLYIMLALGLNIVVGFAGLLDLGYIAFYAVGAYLAAFSVHHSLRLFWRRLSKIIRHSGIFW
jgi:branched-chain amino acid transport system permease protein